MQWPQFARAGADDSADRTTCDGLYDETALIRAESDQHMPLSLGE
jgi:hypothetical protein